MILEPTIQMLLEAAVIEKANSSWKHCPYGHKLFTCTVFLELMNCCLSVVEEKYFSQFFHQLHLEELDKTKIAFYVLGDLWQFTRCPFELKNVVLHWFIQLTQKLSFLDPVIQLTLKDPFLIPLFKFELRNLIDRTL
jgi:hypothetical protein